MTRRPILIAAEATGMAVGIVWLGLCLFWAGVRESFHKRPDKVADMNCGADRP